MRHKTGERARKIMIFQLVEMRVYIERGILWIRCWRTRKTHLVTNFWGSYTQIGGIISMYLALSMMEENQFVGMILVGTALETLAANIHQKSFGSNYHLMNFSPPIANQFHFLASTTRQ